MQRYNKLCYYFFLLITLSKINLTSSKRCEILPSQCQFVNYKRVTANQGKSRRKFDGIVCENKLTEETIHALKKTFQRCSSLKESVVRYTIKPAKGIIFDQSLETIFKLGNTTNTFINLDFLNVKGFDIESFIYVSNVIYLTIYTDFNLYKQNHLVKGCDEFKNLNSSQGFIFRQKYKNTPNFFLQFIKPKKTHSICSLFFRNTKIENFRFRNLINSYILSNVFYFRNPNEEKNITQNLNSNIVKFGVSDCYGLNLDLNFLNPLVFENTFLLEFIGHINSIDAKLFRSLINVRIIRLNLDIFIELIKKRGIEWIKNINLDVNVNFNNMLEIENQMDRRFLISCSNFKNHNELEKFIQIVPNEDFCLFEKFPFQQMVFISIHKNPFILNPKGDIQETGKAVYSCTDLWLYQFYDKTKIFFSNLELKILSASNFTACHFERRLAICNKTLWNHKESKNFKEHSKINFSSFDFILVFQLTLMVLTSLLSGYAIFSNLLTIYVIFHKKNVKITREKHYIYMSLHCISNVFIASIQILNLMSECQYPIGIYCSSIRLIKGIQYVKIIFGEYLNSVFRLLSNFTYLGFSLCRMSKIGKEHGKLIVYMNEKLSIKVYIVVCLFISACLSVCKALQFDINLVNPDYAAPIPFIQNTSRMWFFKAGYIAITIINTFYDIINYFVFVLVHLVVDLVLISKLKQVIKEKEANTVKMMVFSSGEDREKAFKENEESKRRAFSMVFFSSVLNMITKVPSMITSINDMRLLIINPINEKDLKQFENLMIETKLSFKTFCLSDNTCRLFQSSGNCLFMLSLCSIMHFLKHFDKNFKDAFQQALFPEKNDKNKTNNNNKNNNSRQRN